MPGNDAKRARVDPAAADASDVAFDPVGSAGEAGTADSVAPPSAQASTEQAQILLPTAADMAARRQAIRARSNNSAERFAEERAMIAALPNEADLGTWLQKLVEKHGWEAIVRLLFRHCPSERLTRVLQEMSDSLNPFRELDTSRAWSIEGACIGGEATTAALALDAPPSAPRSQHAGRTRPLSTDVQSPQLFIFREWSGAPARSGSLCAHRLLPDTLAS